MFSIGGYKFNGKGEVNGSSRVSTSIWKIRLVASKILTLLVETIGMLSFDMTKALRN